MESDTTNTNSKKTARFDIAKLASLPEADMEIIDTDGHGTGWVWTFAGPGHPVTVEADRRQGQRFLEREAEKERSQVNGRKWKGAAEKIDDRRQSGIDYVVGRLLRWTDIELNGAAFPFSRDNAVQICSDPNFNLVYEQANAFLLAEKSFTKRSV